MLSITGVIASFSSSSPNVKEGDNYTVTVSLDKPPGRLIGFIIETIPLSATSMYTYVLNGISLYNVLYEQSFS